MALKTRAKFYYGPEINPNEISLNITEDGIIELTVTLTPSNKSPQSLARELEDALNAVGNNTYTVSINRITRILTISADAPFDLLIATGSIPLSPLWSKLGFTGFVDQTGLSSYSGDTAVGFEFVPQFYLLDYVPPTRNQDTIESTTNETASGEVEVVRFGIKKFLDLNIDFITNIKMAEDSLIENNSQGVEDAEAFMQNAVKRGLLEFMEDRDNPDNFIIVRLESTPQNRQGLGFRLDEKIGEGLPEYFKTGQLKFRVQE